MSKTQVKRWFSLTTTGFFVASKNTHTQGVRPLTEQQPSPFCYFSSMLQFFFFFFYVL